MAEKICEKCNGPLLEENGKLICGICGKVYPPTCYFEEEYEANGNNKYAHFFDTVSLEKFRRINKRLVASVANNHDSTVVALSNGQYFTRYLKHHNEDYVGQCSVERWLGVENVVLFDGCINDKFAVGVTSDGELQTTMLEVQKVFDHIKELGISDMRMKQVCAVSFECSPAATTQQGKEEYFVGLDVNGRIVIHNPYAVFKLERREGAKHIAKKLQEIRTWPSLKHLEYTDDSEWELYGVTEDGQTKYIGFDSPRVKAPAWTDIIQFDSIGYSERKTWLGLKKDGTLVKEKPAGGHDIDIAFLKDVIQFRKLDAYGKKVAFLLRGGNVVVVEGEQKKCVGSNIVAIVDDGFVFADGTLHTYTYKANPQYVKVPDIKLFENITTIEEEWAAIPQLCTLRKNQLTKKLHDANSLIDKMQQDVKAMEAQRISLGLFKGKEKKALTEQIEVIQQKITFQKQIIADINAYFPDGKPTWKYIPPTPRQAPSTYIHPSVLKAQMNSTNTSKKDTSVIGSAAVGALIAGPTGAVVGAIFAADKNQKNRK